MNCKICGEEINPKGHISARSAMFQHVVGNHPEAKEKVKAAQAQIRDHKAQMAAIRKQLTNETGVWLI